ncbi:hypothetical protein PR048_005375, partial [Dryococelus australis]
MSVSENEVCFLDINDELILFETNKLEMFNCVNQLLGDLKLQSCTGKAQAHEVAALLEEWKIIQQANATCFDTSDRNTCHK